MVYFSSEHPYEEGSEQYAWLEADLKRARENANTKWIILADHRPFYSSDSRQFTNHSKLAIALENLIHEYAIDIVQTGHQHCYERTWPIDRQKVDR